MQGNNFKNNEKLDYKVCKNQPNFLKTLSKNGLTPKVLNFKLTNSNLFYSNTCKKCQFSLLKEEIKSRVSVSIRQRKEFKNVKASIKSKVSTFNFAHTLCLFVVENDSKPCKFREVHSKKLHNLGLESAYDCYNPDKVVFNYSLYRLSNFV